MRDVASRNGPHAEWAWPRRGVVVAVVLAAVTAGVLMAALTPPLCGATFRHAAVLTARGEDAEAVLDLLRGSGTGVDDPLEFSRLPSGGWAAKEGQKALASRLGERAGPALAAALCEWDRELSRTESSYSDSIWDETAQVVACEARAHPTAAGDRALLAVACDREMHMMARLPAFVALCRPGNDAAIEPLIDVALDDREDANVREQLLARLPRFDRRLPVRLRDLLDRPWLGLDRMAACALAATGDPEAPSLVVRELRDAARLGRSDARALAGAAALRLTGGAVPGIDETLVRKSLDEFQGERFAAVVKAQNAAADALAAWIDQNPAVRETAWERRHAERSSSVRLASLRRIRSVDDLLAAPDESIDIAATTQWLLHGEHEAHVDDLLEEVDRLAEWLRPRLRGAAAGRETLERMQALLVPALEHAGAFVDASELAMPLRCRTGNCLAWTSLFVALGDRLGLPLHAVALPKHVFVRWDDGTTRVNIDPSNGGAVRSDEEYAEPHGGLSAVLASGSYLRPLTRREFVSIAMSNAAIFIGGNPPWDAPTALRRAQDAVRIDPGNRAGWTALADAASRIGPSRRDELRAAVAAAQRLLARDRCPNARMEGAALAESLARGGLGEEALALLDAESAPPPEFRVARVLALIACGRDADALRLQREIDEQSRMPGGSVLTVVASFGITPADGWTALDRALTELPPIPKSADWRVPRLRDALVLEVAWLLLDFGAPTTKRAQLAMEVAQLCSAGESSLAATSAPPITRARLLDGDRSISYGIVKYRHARVVARAQERLDAAK